MELKKEERDQLEKQYFEDDLNSMYCVQYYSCGKIKSINVMADTDGEALKIATSIVGADSLLKKVHPSEWVYRVVNLRVNGVWVDPPQTTEYGG